MVSRSKRRQQQIDENMDVDEDTGFTDKHQLILQYLMHARMSKKRELSHVHGKLFNGSETLSETINAVTQKINFLKMDIKHIRCDITGETYYVLIHTTGDSFFPRCCILNKSQIEFLKQVLTGIVLASDGSVGKIQALNSCQVLTKSEADEAIKLFKKEKILVESEKGMLSMSPLAIVEFEPFFRSCLSDNLNSCDLCKQLVFVGKLCEGSNCGLKFHKHCVSKWLSSKHLECPKCQQVWNVDSGADTD